MYIGPYTLLSLRASHQLYGGQCGLYKYTFPGRKLTEIALQRVEDTKNEGLEIYKLTDVTIVTR